MFNLLQSHPDSRCPKDPKRIFGSFILLSFSHSLKGFLSLSLLLQHNRVRVSTLAFGPINDAWGPFVLGNFAAVRIVVTCLDYVVWNDYIR